MALTPIQEVRVSVGDTSVEFPILSDDSYQYFLDKNDNSVRRASLDAARSILFQLSTRSSETVDIFTINGGKTAEQYRLALTLFLKDPSLNPVLVSGSAYAGGISRSDMNNNNNVSDNNFVSTPGMNIQIIPSSPWSVL